MSPRTATILVLVVALSTAAGCSALGPTGSTGGDESPATETHDGDCGPAPAAGTATPTAGGDADSDGSDADAGNDGTDATTATPGATAATATAGNGSVTVNGTLPDRFDADLDVVYRRTERLVGVEAPPPTVTVTDVGGAAGSSGARPVVRATGLAEMRTDAAAATGTTRRVGDVRIDPNDASAGQIERSLVHEFAHHLQFAQGWTVERGDVPESVRGTTEHRLLYFATTEGPAVLVADAYARRHGNGTGQGEGNGTGQAERIRRNFESGPAGNQYAWAPYYYGHRHASERTAGPADLGAYYADPPRTTAALVSGTGRDPPVAPLSLDSPTVVDGWRHGETDVMGALFLTALLWGDHGGDRAEAVAGGWRADRLYRYEDGGDHGFVWVHRWATGEDAATYLDAVEETLAQHGAVDATRLDDHTTAVAFGDAAFVETATVGCDGGAVVVSEASP